MHNEVIFDDPRAKDSLEPLEILWRECFDDSEEYIHEFFRHFNYRQTLHTLSKEGEILSLLYALPLDLHLDGVTHRAVYLYALATQERERRKGLMSYLIRQTEEQLYHEGITYSFLIPESLALSEYYQRRGYHFCSSRTYRPITASTTEREVKDTHLHYLAPRSTTDALFRYYDKKQKTHLNRLLQSAESFKMNITNCTMGGGAVLTAERKGEIEGIAFLSLENEKGYITQIEADSLSTREQLIQKIRADYTGPLFLIEEGEEEPFGMVKHIHGSSTELERGEIAMSLLLDR